MTSFKLIGSALVLAAFVAAPVSAQQAVQEPGAYAFYHPNADVLNAGAPAPATGGFASTVRPSDSMAQMQMSARPHHTRHTMKQY
jgi:hypothetical protein